MAQEEKCGGASPLEPHPKLETGDDLATAAYDHQRNQRTSRRPSLLREYYSDPYRHVFDAAVLAGFEAAEQLSDVELAGLESYSGIVGLVAQQVLRSRQIAGTR
jgi:hypothetical protein